MAQLTNDDYRELRRTVYRWGDGKDELKARPNLPSETELRGAFQAIEDWWSDNQASLKAAIDAAIGFTTSAALARKIGKAWLIWKFKKGG